MARCPECGRENGHANGCPMADISESIIGYCDICGEPIYEWEDRYEDLDGYDYVCEECLTEVTHAKLVHP